MQAHIEPVTHADRHMTERQKDADALDDRLEMHEENILGAIKAGEKTIVPAPWNFPTRAYLPVWEVIQDMPCHPSTADAIWHGVIRVFCQRVNAGDKYAEEVAQQIADVYAKFCAGASA